MDHIRFDTMKHPHGGKAEAIILFSDGTASIIGQFNGPLDLLQEPPPGQAYVKFEARDGESMCVHIPGSWGAACEIATSTDVSCLLDDESLAGARAWQKKHVDVSPTESSPTPLEEPEESPYVTQSREFLDKTLALVKGKNADYCADSVADPLENLRLSEKTQICSTGQAIMSRMMDKIARARNLILETDREAQVDESVEDTLSDIIGYTLLLRYYASNRGS